MNGAPSSTWFTASPDWGWFIVLYFFLGGLAGGCYFLASAHRPVRQTRGPSARTPGLLRCVSLRRAERPSADCGSRAAAALLAHDDRKQHISADVQVLVADVDRCLGAPRIRVVQLPVLSGSACRGRTAFVQGFRLAKLRRTASRHRRGPLLRTIGARWPIVRRFRAPSGLGRVISVTRRNLRPLYRRIYRSPAGGHQPSDLVRHAAARHALRRIGHVDVGGNDHVAGAQIRLDAAGPCQPVANGNLGDCAGVARAGRGDGVARAGVARVAECLGPLAPDRDRSRNGRCL